jgi:hypothetical protein
VLGSIQILLDIVADEVILNRSNRRQPPADWIDPSLKAEAAMHPVNYLFEDIYRNHWGIPKGNAWNERKRWYGSRRRRSARDAAAIWQDGH